MAKSASAIMVGARQLCRPAVATRVEMLAHPAAAVPDLFDGISAVGVEHLRKFGVEQAVRAP